MIRHSTPVIPAPVYEHITAPENKETAVEAMHAFILEENEEQFEYAVALYVASAQHRNEPIEKVVGTLCQLAAEMEGPHSEILLRPSRMHELIFTGILRAFYGDVAVDRGTGARAQRKADAPQHSQSGTWPRKPAE